MLDGPEPGEIREFKKDKVTLVTAKLAVPPAGSKRPAADSKEGSAEAERQSAREAKRQRARELSGKDSSDSE